MTYIDDVANRIERQLAPEQRPKRHAAELYRLYALLALTRGEEVTLPNVHDAWSAWMTQWAPVHESLRPFAELPSSVQRQDEPYAEAIRQVARDLLGRDAVSA